MVPWSLCSLQHTAAGEEFCLQLLARTGRRSGVSIIPDVQ
jgi:hypothetical protein